VGARTGELAARSTIERGGRLKHVGYALRWLQSPEDILCLTLGTVNGRCVREWVH